MRFDRRSITVPRICNRVRNDNTSNRDAPNDNTSNRDAPNGNSTTTSGLTIAVAWRGATISGRSSWADDVDETIINATTTQTIRNITDSPFLVT